MSLCGREEGGVTVIHEGQILKCVRSQQNGFFLERAFDHVEENVLADMRIQRAQAVVDDVDVRVLVDSALEVRGSMEAVSYSASPSFCGQWGSGCGTWQWQRSSGCGTWQWQWSSGCGTWQWMRDVEQWGRDAERVCYSNGHSLLLSAG